MDVCRVVRRRVGNTSSISIDAGRPSPSRLPPPPLPLPLPPRRDRSRFARRDAPTRGASPPASAFLALAVAAFLVTDAHAAVSCGGHSASTCAECPQGNGAAWCNGECRWDDASSGCAAGCAQHAASAQCVAPLCEWMTPTAVCRDALAEGIRSASVHLWHTTPSTVAAPAWWFNRVVVTESSSVAYFMYNGFAYGYGGVQQVSKSPFVGRVIFSLWDQGECDRDVRSCAADLVARTVACGSRATCTDFGGEGTGRKSYFDSSLLPVVGEPYYFVTHAEPVGADRARYAGYFYASALGGWRLLSQIEVSLAGKPWHLWSLYSFVEQWTGQDALDARSATYGPSFASGDLAGAFASFAQVPSAKFGHGKGENHAHVNAHADAARGGVNIATGGGVVRVAAEGDVFVYPAAEKPAALEAFAAAAPCLIAGSGDAAKLEACLACVGEAAADKEACLEAAEQLPPSSGAERRRGNDAEIAKAAAFAFAALTAVAFTEFI